MAAPQDRQNALEEAGEAVREVAGDVADRTVPGLRGVLEFELLTVSGITITLGSVLVASLVLAAGIFASRLVRRALSRYGTRNPRISSAAMYTLSRVVHYVILFLAIMIALDIIGIPVGKFAVFAGAIGVGLGFALQAIFSNFISGLILLFDRSLKAGDFVELESGVHGEVRDIKIRATTIVTNDNIDILVPNSEFVSGRVTNWTHRDISRRMRIPFGVAYGTDKETVKKAALEAAGEVPFTLEQDGPRRPQVWLVEFGDSSLNYELVVWLTAEATKRPSAVKAAYNWAIHSALAKYDLEIPFPQQDVHVRSLFGLTDRAALRALRLDIPQAPHDAPAESPQLRNDAIDDVKRDIRESAENAAAAALPGEQQP